MLQSSPQSTKLDPRKAPRIDRILSPPIILPIHHLKILLLNRLILQKNQMIHIHLHLQILSFIPSLARHLNGNLEMRSLNYSHCLIHLSPVLHQKFGLPPLQWFLILILIPHHSIHSIHALIIYQGHLSIDLNHKAFQFPSRVLDSLVCAPHYL